MARKPTPETKNKPNGAQWPADRVRRMRTDDLVPYARNARMHTNAQVDQLAQAIQRFGFTNPVIVDERGEIIAGHGRVMAARRLNLEEVPGVVIADGEWSQDDIRAYRIWDNQSALLSAWSPEMLRVEISALKLAEYPLALTGFDDKSLVSYMAGVNATAPSQFPEVGDGIATEHSCPKCGYRWSGKSDAAPRPEK
jgi:hypothetical protein